jgi:glycine betaine/proline transport system ATP-binding protein
MGQQRRRCECAFRTAIADRFINMSEDETASADGLTTGSPIGEPQSEIAVEGASTPGGDVAVFVEDLWKIFGRNPERVLKPDFRDLPKSELQSKTGNIVGLRNVSFQVKFGELFVLMGLSGSGKSTLIRALIRLMQPTAGKLWVDGSDVLSMTPRELLAFRRSSISMVFQNYGLLPHYTVLQNAGYGLKLRGDDKAAREEQARAALDTVGLTGWEDYYPSSLSGGMQQRVGLARALATDPDILLMDEPFSGLDPLIRRELQDEFIDLQDKLGKTIVFVTHDLHEALKLGDRIAIMRDGEIVQIAEPEEILSNPYDDYVRAFTQDASVARVFTASTVMDDPEVLLYHWQGPRAAHAELEHTKREWAFMVDKKHTYLGICTHDLVDDLIRRNERRIDAESLDRPDTVDPNVVIEDLYGLVSAESYPLPVTDEQGKLLGIIRPRAILDALHTSDSE